MEKILLTKGIKMVNRLDSSEDLVRNYAYNDDLLAKRMFIEFYFAQMEEEVETAIFVHALGEDCSYSFTITVEAGIIEMAFVRLFRIITDVVDFIKTCPVTTVLSDLSTISTGTNCSTEWQDKAESKRIYQAAVKEFNLVGQLIELKKSGLN